MIRNIFRIKTKRKEELKERKLKGTRRKTRLKLREERPLRLKLLIPRLRIRKI